MNRDNLIIANDPIVFNIAIKWYKMAGYNIIPKDKRIDIYGICWFIAIIIKKNDRRYKILNLLKSSY